MKTIKNNEKSKFTSTNRKKTTKRTVALVVVISLLFSFTVSTIFASSSYVTRRGVTEDGWRYSVDDISEVTIIGYSGNSTEVTLPAEVDGLPVTHTCYNMLTDTPVEKLIIPDCDNLYQFYGASFSSSDSLKEVKIGSMFAEVIGGILSDCIKLNKVVFSDDFTLKANEYNNSNKEFELGSFISSYAFSACPSLKTFVVPEGIQSVLERSFMNDNIENFVLPTTVNDIDLSQVFYSTNPEKYSLKSLKNLVVQNKDMDIYCDDFSELSNATIYGYIGSKAEQIAKENNIPFIDLATIDLNALIESFWEQEQPVTTTTETTETTETTTVSETSETSATSTTSEISETSTSSLPETSTSETSETSTATSSTSETSETTETTPVNTSTVSSSTSSTTSTTVPVTTTVPVKEKPVYLGMFNRTVYVKANNYDFRISNNLVKSKTMSYKSNNNNIATAYANGKITAKKKGVAYVTVLNKKNNSYFKVKVTVINPKINKYNVTLKKGKSFNLKIVGRVGTAKFISSNKKIATVNKYGKITASKKKKGTVTITVKTNGVTLECRVRVK
ncbi:MAG: leucine-rich repeat protein [Ruminococcus sp.]